MIVRGIGDYAKGDAEFTMKLYNTLQPRIVCAAIRSPEGVVFCGPRHHHCFAYARPHMGEQDGYDAWEQGFVDQYNEFYSREDAWSIAKAAGQIRFHCGDGDSGSLTSENLY